MIVFDTYAWIEYFRGSPLGKKVQIFLDNEDVITPSLVLVELSVKAAKEGWDFEKHLRFIQAHSLIIGISENVIKQSGKLYVMMRKKHSQFGLIDAVILLTGKERNARILTGDPHFKGLDKVEFLE